MLHARDRADASQADLSARSHGHGSSKAAKVWLPSALIRGYCVDPAGLFHVGADARGDVLTVWLQDHGPRDNISAIANRS